MPELDVPRASLIAVTVLAQAGPMTEERAAEWARKIAEPMIAAELRREAARLRQVTASPFVVASLLNHADKIDGGTP